MIPVKKNIGAGSCSYQSQTCLQAMYDTVGYIIGYIN